MNDADIDRLKAACDTLSEHFDSVQIFCTRTTDSEDDEQGTVNCQWGTGNWFARKGQVSDWLLKEDEYSRLEARNRDA